MGQGQVRQHAVCFARTLVFFEEIKDALGHICNAAKVVHHPFGLTGGTRGVHQHGQIVGRTMGFAGHGAGFGHDVVPALERCSGRQWHGNAWHPFRHTRGLIGPSVELADKQQTGLAVLEHKPNGVGVFSGENGHRGVTGHPNGQLGHEKVGAVFRQDAHFGPRRQALALQMRGHAPRLVHGLRPGVGDHLTPTGGLGQKNLLGQVFFMAISVIEQSGFGHGVRSSKG